MTTRKSAIDLIATVRPDIAAHDQDVVPEPARDQLLRSIMAEQSTSDKARKPLYRRPVAIGAYAAGVVALALIVTEVIPSGGSAPVARPAPSPTTSAGPVMDAAYIVGRMTAAAANDTNDVVHVRTALTPPGQAPDTGYIYDSWYRYDSGVSRLISTLPDGTVCLDVIANGIAPPRHPQFPDSLPMNADGNTRLTALNHQNHTWWAWSWAELNWPAPPACATYPGSYDTWGHEYSSGYGGVLAPATNIGGTLAMLADGSLRVAGNGPVVDGQPTIELTGAFPSGVAETDLVSATTYQPLRDISTYHGYRVETDIEFRQPTAANLAQLTLTVPPGYRQVAPPVRHH